jgi:hypothetical protein
MNLRLVSTPFDDKSYYVNIRKAVTAGYFMQVGGRARVDRLNLASWSCSSTLRVHDQNGISAVCC